ncbi:MAG: ATP-dependent RecD-like DNA helicase [Clostridiales bacterium]|jgi:exodeoxyribonuclease V alpha subunit|nr:ATP-dependent RecD-like DNA helicase [Clostridiales bacterium]
MTLKTKKKSEVIKIECRVKNIIFRNENSGYTVFNSALKADNDEIHEVDIVCVGYLYDIKIKENLGLTGEFINHEKYGIQFKISYVDRKISLNKKNIINYLSSGFIKGVGPKIAERIVNKFGEKTFELIKNDFRSLCLVSGVTEKIASRINDFFLKDEKTRSINIFLQDLNISSAYIARIYKTYGDKTIEIILNNPYALIDDIDGIGFRKADEIANSMGISLESNFRIQAAIKYILEYNSETHGHTYMPHDNIIEETYKLISIDKNLIRNNLATLEEKKILVCDKEKIYSSLFYNIENYIAEKILTLNKNFSELKISFEDIKKFAASQNLNIDHQQLIAVHHAIINGVTIITGGPGTGKTTTLKFLVKLINFLCNSVELCAPTGRAAKKMQETTLLAAKTIHRLLGIDHSTGNFEHNEKKLLKTNYLIVDESSMMDSILMCSLLKALDKNTKLILIGDVDQLPSVGPGNILRDLIESNKFKVVRLKKIFRQAKESSIIVNAHKINNGEVINFSDKKSDFVFINCDNNERATKIILNIINKKNVNNIQILSPIKRFALGTINLNKILQEKINPKKSFKHEIYDFREGDKVIQIKNNYSREWSIFKNNCCISKGRGVFNGDIGYVTNIDHSKNILKVKFDDKKIVDYEFLQLIELNLAYATTIHKSQGCEYDVVIIPILSIPPMLLSRNLLYTAVTRAKKIVIIIGSKKIVYSMIKNNKNTQRFTDLKNKLKKQTDLI